MELSVLFSWSKLSSCVIPKETREGWPLLTVETEVNEESKRTNEKGPFFVGLLSMSFRTAKIQYRKCETEKELRGLSLNFLIHGSVRNYIFPRSVCLFCCMKICGPNLGIYKRSQTHECENWD
jgi:hypothetical protein